MPFWSGPLPGEWRYPLIVTGADVWAREQDADDGTDDAGADDGVVTSSQRYRFKASELTS